MAELTEEMLNSLEDLQVQYQTVRDGFEHLDTQGQFENANQREQMAESVKVALMNWVRAKNRILGDSDSTVNALRTEAGKAQKAIEESLKSIQSIKEKLNLITKALNAVASVVATLK